MARDKTLMTQERKDIHDTFTELFNIREHGARKYNLDWIYAEIGQRFYKTPETVRRIISSPLPEKKLPIVPPLP